MTQFHEFTRPDGELVTLEVQRNRWPDPCEILKAHTEREGWSAQITDDENETWGIWIDENTPEPGYEYSEDDVPLFGAGPREIGGTPLSELAGRPDGTVDGQIRYENFVRIAKSWGYE